MSRIVDIEPLLKKYDGMNEGTEFSPIHFINDLMALEQLLFTEKEELLRVGKGAVKARQGRFVIYDVDWLKENFYTTEEKIYGQPKQPCIEDYPTCTECEHYDKENHYCPRFCQVIKDTLAETQPSEDCISRTELLAKIDEERKHLLELKMDGAEHIIVHHARRIIEDMPSVYPERPKGKWIMNSDYPDRLICEKCKAQFDVWHWESKQMHFCPNCGAEMSGGGEDEG